jgi:RNA polymerase sigma-70 factor (ECF subfamily)
MAMTNPGDLSILIERWRAGDERAAEALYQRHIGPIYRLAFGLLASPEDAEEVAQDVLAYALSHIDAYDAGRSRFTTWLHTITISRCRDKRRRRWLPRLSLTALFGRGGDIPDPARRPEQVAAAGETRGEVWAAVQALSPALREAVLLRYWSEHTYREMAEILGCPVPTAQSRVRLAFQELRHSLNRSDWATLEKEALR